MPPSAENTTAPDTVSRPSPALPIILLLVAAYAAAIYLPFLGTGRMLTSHEGMVAHPALRILSDGVWIVPPYAAGHWLDKQPLVNWLAAVCFAVAGGFSEFAARLPAALSAILLCLLVTVVAARFETRRAALLAGLAQASMVYLYMQGRLGEVDTTFALLVTAAHFVLLWHWGKGTWHLPWKAAVLFHVVLALAVLTKGFLAVVLVGLTILALCWLAQTWQPLRVVVVTPAVLLFVLIAGGWHLAAYLAVGQEALDQWRYNSVLRFFGLHHLQPKTFFLYLYTVPWMVLPCGAALVIAAPRLRRAARAPDGYVDRFVWAAFFAGMLFLMLSFHKAKHYVVPVLPVLTLLIGRVLDWHVEIKGRAAQVFYASVFSVALLAFGLVSGVVMPARDHRRPTVEFAQRVTGDLPADAVLLVTGLGQHAVYPYLAHPRIVYADEPEAIRRLIAERGGAPLWALTVQKRMPDAEKLGLQFEELAREEPRRKLNPGDELVFGRLLGFVASGHRSQPTTAKDDAASP
ncbi:MAG: glycosyltransferase family 39 protein [Phycisphaerales bacterium]|nr:glycosyltransferase family 39 protein [Phycisphaerales bacterium]